MVLSRATSLQLDINDEQNDNVDYIEEIKENIRERGKGQELSSRTRGRLFECYDDGHNKLANMTMQRNNPNPITYTNTNNTISTNGTATFIDESHLYYNDQSHQMSTLTLYGKSTTLSTTTTKCMISTMKTTATVNGIVEPQQNTAQIDTSSNNSTWRDHRQKSLKDEKFETNTDNLRFNDKINFKKITPEIWNDFHNTLWDEYYSNPNTTRIP
ncbi:hypothetical protein GLOIN_2v1771340 [Rhizophagus irregularis DAOM 181602=DAOM 197198]|uniref:Uncharacterized protein n=1 Tax=Rhizophagus irregularis (strain DAOM 181602 / DAOM 197198 / MUCL 43194) TaxID=747089 RepID=A0A2P4QA26_RHIID|nr:hypothetical protein GLOIN_2v1771340 [Rhizophagus irregularis DAOM 181602=DAOM 197198]POG74495.1 hypothetical protein GLOIN_2v1771340 [Rhizophagus irregularis DAOM 181602=DAOM 197198]|eukprot:XP_025181361.1 hypothetical protein GLOIN_2v1771340 [Rhizophagus irregularis DAOM 181602=DAOM 197198]